MFLGFLLSIWHLIAEGPHVGFSDTRACFSTLPLFLLSFLVLPFHSSSWDKEVSCIWVLLFFLTLLYIFFFPRLSLVELYAEGAFSMLDAAFFFSYPLSAFDNIILSASKKLPYVTLKLHVHRVCPIWSILIVTYVSSINKTIKN